MQIPNEHVKHTVSPIKDWNRTCGILTQMQKLTENAIHRDP